MENLYLIENYGKLIQKLKEEKIIRTKNVVGEIGEFYAIHYFNKTKGLPKLQRTLVSTKNVDAISNKGERYSIKTTTSNLTGCFFGLTNEQEKLFEYILIVKLDNFYHLKRILQVDWNTFLKEKNWNNRLKAWNLRITDNLLKSAKIIY